MRYLDLLESKLAFTKPFQDVLSHQNNLETKNIYITECASNLSKLLAAYAFSQNKQTVVYITSSIYEASKAYEVLCDMTGTDNVSFFPAEEFISSELVATSEAFRLARMLTFHHIVQYSLKLVSYNSIHLSNYYQGLNAETKNLIEPNTKWYLGVVGAGASYKASICSTIETGTDTRTCAKTTSVTTNIGLSRTGELFTSQISRGTKSTFWTLTPDGNSHFYYVSAKDGVYYIGNATEENGARPSMYLKQNVVISKDNTGDGTYEHPYDIELGS